MLWALDENKNPYLPPDIIEAAMQFEDYENRKVAQDTVGKYFVSTMFIAIDQDFTWHFVEPNPHPLVFETSVFENMDNNPDTAKRELYSEHYHTWKEAETRHQEIVKLLGTGMSPELLGE